MSKGAYEECSGNVSFVKIKGAYPGKSDSRKRFQNISGCCLIVSLNPSSSFIKGFNKA